jgi:hypothetical protein
MTSRISHTTIDVHDAYAMSSWWKEVLGYTDLPGDPNVEGEDECMIIDPISGHRLLFIEVEERKASNRVHLDLTPTDRRRDGEIERVLALGATRVADRRNDDGTGWMVLADPEGNEFCILRSDEERAETNSPSVADDNLDQ